MVWKMNIVGEMYLKIMQDCASEYFNTIVALILSCAQYKQGRGFQLPHKVDFFVIIGLFSSTNLKAYMAFQNCKFMMASLAWNNAGIY